MNFFKHNIWAVVLLGLLFSFILPPIGILMSPFVQLFFMVIMFFSTLNISIRKVMTEIHHPSKILISLFLIHLASPLLLLPLRGFFSEEIFLGLILASVVPSGISVVFLSKLFGGDPSRSLVITTISSLLSPITVPVLILLFAQTSIAISPFAMALTITKLVILPFCLARIVAQTKYKKSLDRYTLQVMLITLFLIIIGIISPLTKYVLSTLPLFMVLSGLVTVLNVILFLAGFSIGSTHEAKASYGITATFKNFTLSTVLALSLFNAEVALPAIAYSVINSFLLIPMQWFIEGQKPHAKG